MFKIILFLVMSFSASAIAADENVSLDTLYALQEIINISPVEYQGYPVVALGGHEAAALICQSADFNRVVEFKTQKIKGKSLRAATPLGERSVSFEIKSWSGVVIFNSIKCAR